LKDYYQILEIPKNSTQIEIQKAYRRLAKVYHPDVNKSKDAHERFLEISEAYEYLLKHIRQVDVRMGDRNVHFRSAEEFEKFREEVKARAQQQAKMKYEEFKKQHEAFQKSGINDMLLILGIAVRILLLPLIVFFVLLPVYLSVTNDWALIFILLITWPFAGMLIWYVRDNRKKYISFEKLYYTPQVIKQIFTDVHETDKKCYYSPNELANSKPYKLELLKLKDLKLSSAGFRQHTVNYINESAIVYVPRSQKALIVHSACILIKVVSIIASLLFFNISSIVWQIILGMFAGGFISWLVLLFTGTKSNVSFLFSNSNNLRILIWLLLLMQVTKFTFSPFNIYTSEYIYFVVFSIILFDCFLMQLLNFILGKNANKPIVGQYSELNQKFEAGFKVYNDVSVISVIYPLSKWIFG